MKLKPLKLVPVLVAAGAISVGCLVQLSRLDFFERLERITYDMRARQALRFNPTVATNLGFVCINEASIDFVRTNSVLGYRYGLYWPRQLYGRVASELAAEGAKAVAFDVIFGELRPNHPPVQMADNTLVESDEFFAIQMQRAGNVIIALTPDKPPPALFRTNALAVGDILTVTDSDGILRRAKPFHSYLKWHPAFLQLADNPEYGINLDQARIEKRRIVLPRKGGKEILVPLEPPRQFRRGRLWRQSTAAGHGALRQALHRGARLAHGHRFGRAGPGAQPGQSRGGHAPGANYSARPGQFDRVIPLDAQGYFLVNWCLPPEHPALTRQSVRSLLLQDRLRLKGRTNELKNLWRDKLAVVGSRAVGNDLSDRGATPLEHDTWLVSKHWNVASSVITGRFIRLAPMALDLLLILGLGATAAAATWQLRALVAFGAVLSLATAYTVFAAVVYVKTRYWLPIVVPVTGAIFTTYVCLLAWQVVFEQAERRRVKSIFSKMVSPKIVNELLAAQTLSLVGTRREDYGLLRRRARVHRTDGTPARSAWRSSSSSMA